MNEELFQNTSDDILAGRALPAEMLGDLLAIASISDEDAQRIADTLEQMKGFIPPGSLDDLIQQTLGEDADQRVVHATSNALMNLRSSRVESLIDKLKKWIEANPDREKIFPELAVQQLNKNLKKIIQDQSSVTLMRKADELTRDVGNELQNVKFVCDLRPVFNEDRTKVEAFIPLANLRLLYMSQDGNKHTCEVSLTELELERLISDAKLATKKLSVLGSVDITDPARESHA